jgi:hypothetical protein
MGVMEVAEPRSEREPVHESGPVAETMTSVSTRSCQPPALPAGAARPEPPRSDGRAVRAVAGLLLGLALALPAASEPMAPLQVLDLEPGDLHDPERIQKILGFVADYQVREGQRKLVRASELSVAVPNTYGKARRVIEGVAKLQAAADSAGLREQLDSMLVIGIKTHNLSFDHPDLGYVEPDGWKWEWLLTQEASVCAAYEASWRESGYTLTRAPTVEAAHEHLAGTGRCPTGWLRVNPRTRTAHHFRIMGDLRIPEFRSWLIGRYQAVVAEANVKRAEVSMKSGWLHGDAPVRNTPSTPSGADPWLPSPYPGDSYRDATAAFAAELSHALGGGFWVSLMNTGAPRRWEWLSVFGPGHHARTPDGGLLQTEAGRSLYGYRSRILKLDRLGEAASTPAPTPRRRHNRPSSSPTAPRNGRLSTTSSPGVHPSGAEG